MLLKLALSFVMAGFMPAIHVFLSKVRKAWILGTSPGVTVFAEA